MPALDDAPIEFARVVYQAVVSGNYWLVASLVLIAVLWAVRKVRPSWFATDLVGTATAFGFALLGALAASFGAGAGVSATLFVAAFKVGLGAVGGFSVLWKKVILPLWEKVRN